MGVIVMHNIQRNPDSNSEEDKILKKKGAVKGVKDEIFYPTWRLTNSSASFMYAGGRQEFCIPKNFT